MSSIFQWQGISKSGESRSGEMEGESIGAITALLRRQGLKDIKVKKKPKEFKLFKGKPKILDKDVVIFTRQLAVMVSSGLPLVTCFDLVAKGADNPSVRDATMRIKTSIEAGTTLTEALNAEPEMFDELFVNLVQAGEQAGILETILDRLAIYKEKTAALKAKIKSAMTYPVSVLVIAFVITGVLMIFVVPSFAELFAGFGAKLPLPTQIVIDMSEWTQANWWLVVAAMFGISQAHAAAYKKNPKYHFEVDKLSLNLPVFGMILRKSAVARFARTFSTMIAAGTPILESLENVAKTSGNKVVEAAVMGARASISEGRSLSEPLSESGIFPPMVTQMIGIGESAGNLELMLGKVADFYEEEVDRAVETLTSLMEPIILVILGTLIGGLVVAMYLPIFQMGSAVG